MYYKIENKQCEVYQKLHALRTEELHIEKRNTKAIKEKVGLKWDGEFGHSGQQCFTRVSSIIGFKFIQPLSVNLKVWQEHKQHKGYYIPNSRTKAGREMREFLLNGLERSSLKKVIAILNLNDNLRRFTFPFIEIVGELIIIFLGEGHEPTNDNVIEITKKEFEQIRRSNNTTKTTC